MFYLYINIMRLIDIVNTSIDTDIMIAEEELERLINLSNINTDIKVSRIKDQLKNVITNQLIKAKWLDYNSKFINNEKQND